MKTILNFSIICLVVFSQTLTAEQVKPSSYTPSELKRFAKNAENAGDKLASIDYLNQFLEQKPENAEITFKLASLYYEMRNYQQAEVEFLKAYSLDNEEFGVAKYYYALMKKMNGDYDGALVLFNEFKKEYKRHADASYYRKLATNEIKGIEFAINNKKDSVNVEITKLDSTINNQYLESSPRFINDSTMLYISVQNRFENDSQSSIKGLFNFASKSDNNWTSIVENNSAFNNLEGNIGSYVFSPDGKRLYFSLRTQKWNGKIISILYVSNITENGWSKPVKLNKEINTPNFSSMHPAIGIDKKRNCEILYFVSDKPEGKGGLDIWFSIYNPEKDEYKTPRNLGSKINSKEDDVTPFYDNNTHTLYFSSNGHAGFGGFDIFKSNGAEKSWSKVENLKYPINSEVDDLYYVINNSLKEGFLVSNRTENNGFKNDNIYSFNYVEDNYINTGGNVYAAINNNKLYEFLNKTANSKIVKPINQSSKFTLNQMNEENNEMTLITEGTTDAMGNYSITIEKGKKYNLTFSSENCSEKSLIVDVPKSSTENFLIASVTLENSELENINFCNFYYEVGESSISETDITAVNNTLVELASKFPNVTFEINSYTDNQGDEEFNYLLSAQRAEVLLNNLISKGIDRGRIIVNALGENSSTNETNESKRRTEINIISNNMFLANVSE